MNPQAPQQAQRRNSASIVDTSVPVRDSSSRRAPTERTITVNNKTWQRQNGRIERTMAAMPVHEEFIMASAVPVPKNYDQAVNGADACLWIPATELEIKALQRHRVWEPASANVKDHYPWR